MQSDSILRCSRLLELYRRTDVPESELTELVARFASFTDGNLTEATNDVPVADLPGMVRAGGSGLGDVLSKAAADARLGRVLSEAWKDADLVVTCIDSPIKTDVTVDGNSRKVLNSSASVPHEIHSMLSLFGLVWPRERITWVTTEQTLPLPLAAGVGITEDRSQLPEFPYGISTVRTDHEALKIFANGVLWPVFHMTDFNVEHSLSLVHEAISVEGWRTYEECNEQFAEAATECLGNSKNPVLQVHDYELCLVPEMLRRSIPTSSSAFFHHVVWPNWRHFRLLPEDVRNAILRGILGADVVLFHTIEYAERFLECVENELGTDAVVSGGRVQYDGRVVLVWQVTHGIDVAEVLALSRFPVAEAADEVRRIKQATHHAALCISVERLDFSKGPMQRLVAVERFLDEYPELAGNLVFLQVLARGRRYFQSYRELGRSFDAESQRINDRWQGSVGLKPIHIENALPFSVVAALYHDAPIAWVTSFADGLPLVPKEYIAARGVHTDAGVLVLSRHAGVAKHLRGALMVDPHDPAQMAGQIRRALSLSVCRRSLLMEALSRQVAQGDLYEFTVTVMEILATARKIKRGNVA